MAEIEQKEFGKRREPFAVWIKRKIVTDIQSGCWVWARAKNGGGYGRAPAIMKGKHHD